MRSHYFRFLPYNLLALFIGSFREVGVFGVENDFYEVYAVQAKNILAGGFYTYKHNPPGYCLLLAATTFFLRYFCSG